MPELDFNDMELFEDIVKTLENTPLNQFPVDPTTGEHVRSFHFLSEDEPYLTRDAGEFQALIWGWIRADIFPHMGPGMRGIGFKDAELFVESAHVAAAMLWEPNMSAGDWWPSVKKRVMAKRTKRLKSRAKAMEKAAAEAATNQEG